MPPRARPSLRSYSPCVQESASEQVDVAQVHRLLMPEDADDDGETNRGFGGRHRHDEEDHYVAAGAVELGQRHETEIHRIQHQLDAHEEHDGIPPQQHAGHSETEEHRREAQRLAEEHQTFRLASTTAPMIATSRRIEVISNGIRY